MRYLILGAGPAGLAFANKIYRGGVDSFIVLEQEREAGGLCRSAEVDGFPLDIGGGHFLDIQYPHVCQFLFEFMPEDEWEKYSKDSKIMINDSMIDYPFEANIWQMTLHEQVEYLESIAVAGCNLGKQMPNEFVSWIYWKLGDKIAENYMLPYNQKLYGGELCQLGTYWLEKLPNVSFRETLLSCFERKPYGKQPGHVQFYYPKKYGYGEVWLRMAERIKTHIEYRKKVTSINFKTKTVTTDDGGKYQADVIVTTIPWVELNEFVGMPEDIRKDIQKLKYTSIQTEYFAEKLDTKAHWIYCPDPQLSYHRILVRHNFCQDSRGYWTETNRERVDREKTDSMFRHMNQYAYPLNTVKKPEIMKRLLAWCREQSVIGIGRWGEHQHYNSDVVVDLALKMADELEG